MIPLQFLRLVIVGLFSVQCLDAGTSQSEKSKPNIVFIFSDDQCFETVRANGLVDIDTPNLDRLAKEGATFSHAYNMGSWSGAVCTASRTCLNTGRFLWKAEAALAAAKKGRRRVWSQMMSDAGYETYMSGKWHVPFSAEELFDHTAHVRPGMPETVRSAYNRPVKGEDPSKAWLPWDTSHGGFWKGGRHWSAVLADDSVKFIDEAAKRGKPFFMYLAFNAPHDPRQAPKEYVERYPLDRVEIPESFVPTYPDMGKNGVPKIRDESLAPYPRTDYAIKVHRQEYFASITYMDEQVGRILDAIQASGQADNTWVIFTSDHGLAVGHHGLIGKQNMYEDSLRPPFIIRGAGVKPGTVIDAPIYLQDAMATSLELSGHGIPETVDYKSVLPLLDGRRTANYDAIYGAYKGTQRAIIRDGWKIIVYPKLRKTKLFDLNKDPMERHDLAGNPECAGKLASLTSLLESTMDAMDDPMSSLSAADYPKRLEDWEK